jgi:hypothetical protein
MGQSNNAATGMATVNVFMTPNADSANYDINTSWIDVALWKHQTGSGADFKFTNKTSNASSGYTYRIHVTGTVDDGVNSDNYDQYSNTKVY